VPSTEPGAARTGRAKSPAGGAGVSAIQFGCQSYSWQMSGQLYVGALPHIAKIVRAAGFSGLEPETGMLGGYYDDPAALRDLLDELGLQLGALTIVPEWRGPRESPAEIEATERAFRYLQTFPGAHLMLVQLPGTDRDNLRPRQQSTIDSINAVARRAAGRGIACSFHPNSPRGSLFRVREDYEILVDGLDSRVAGLAADTGHIAKGGMDVVELFEAYRPLIQHVHFKDITGGGEWAAMGAGVIDFARIVSRLRDTDYTGWIMLEDESLGAETDPDAATLVSGQYLQRTLLPLLA
jgi:inosose dehydratase